MRKEKGRKTAELAAIHATAECGVTHIDCPNTLKGICDQAAGHGGSHHCNSCNSVF